MRCDIYKATCSATRKSYIGITSVGYEKRWREHCSASRLRRFQSRSAVHAAIAKYGVDTFSVLLLATTESWASACDEERRLIEEHCTRVPNGYNLIRGGQGRLWTKEERAANAAVVRGRKHSAATRLLMRQKALEVASRNGERERRSARAKAQHAANNLGWHTVTPEGKERVRQAARKGKGIKLAQQAAWAQMTSEEMSRRSYCRRIFQQEKQA